MSRPVTCTYHGPASILSSTEWTEILRGLYRQLPLRSLAWRPASGKPSRVIHELTVEFKPWHAIKDEPPAPQIPVSILERPFVHMFFVQCEDNDTYKATVRKQIKDWHAAVTQRKNQEWLIVLVARPDTRPGASRIFAIKGAVIDKIRADFNVDKRDRCIQLSRLTPHGVEDPSAYSELVGKLKDGIVSSFEAGIATKEEDVKRSDAQRLLPGWNFCTFFILKESLAHSYEGMTIYEDALVQYDELEAAFYESLRDHNHLSQFALFGGTQHGDDSAPLLSSTKKPYRDMILSNVISVFDFRSYVFARQCAMLGRLGLVAEVARKGSYFISTFARTLRDRKDELAPHFVESWTYSSALNLVEQCEAWSRTSVIDPAIAASFNAVRAELFELARKQLDKIGIQAGHLPAAHPFNMSLSEETVATAAASPSAPGTAEQDLPPPPMSITRADLLQAMGDAEAFDNLYIDVTRRTIEGYAASNRKRNAWKLEVSLAALDRHRGRLAPAHAVFSVLPTRYAAQHWSAIEACLLADNLDCHARLGGQRDRAWLKSALSLLRAYAGTGDEERKAIGTLGGGGEDGGLGGVEDFIKQIRDTSAGLDRELADSGQRVLTVNVAQEWADLAEDEDGSTLKIIVTNALPCVVHADEVRLCWSSATHEQLWYTCGKVELAPGNTEVTVSCPMPVHGTFSLDISQVRLSRVLFQNVHNPQSASGPSAALVRRPTVHVPHDPRSLDVRLSMPSEIRLDAESAVLLYIYAGRSNITRATIELKESSGEIVFKHDAATLTEGAAEITPSSTPERLCIQGLAPETSAVMSVPYTGTSRESRIQVSISIDYHTDRRAGQRRTLRRTRDVQLGLPLSVNVQDFFRRSCLFSKFTVTADNNQPLRLRSAQLEGSSDAFEIQCAQAAAREAIAIPAQETGSFVFRIKRRAESPREASSLRFVLTYRTMREEIDYTIEERASTILAGRGLASHTAWVRSQMAATLDRNPDWTSLYAATGELDIGDFEREAWKLTAEKYERRPEEREELLEAAEEVFESVANYTYYESLEDKRWRTLSVPVGLQTAAVVNAVRLSLPRARPIFTGQALPVTVSITPSFAWADATATSQPRRLCYEVQPDLDSWLLSGKAKGEFEAIENETVSVPLCFIPLRFGSLPLPRIVIYAAPEPTRDSGSYFPPVQLTACETYLENAAESVEVLPRSIGGAGWGAEMPSREHLSWPMSSAA